MATLPPVPRLQVSDNVAFLFFSVFARFEYALKASGMYRSSRNYVEPDWEAFKVWADGNLTVATGSEAEHAVQRLLRQPPRIQTGPTTWKNRPLGGATPQSQAIEAARRVRNNLFHGGKHLPPSATGRDAALLEDSLTLLAECISAHPDVGLNFRQ